MRAVHDFTIGPCITVDDEGGELDLQLRLNDGLLVMANLFPDGTIDASVYDDSHGIPVKTIKRMRRLTTSERELIALFPSRDSCQYHLMTGYAASSGLTNGMTN